MKKVAHIIVDKRKYILILYILIIIVSILGMLKVNVNYDMSKYLPEDSATKKGMEQMTEEFGDMASITVMFDDLTEKEQLERKAELEEIPNVKGVVYLQNDEIYQRDNHSRYMITVAENTYSEAAKDVLKAIRDKYKDDKVYISGAVVDNELLVTTITKEIPIIIAVAVVIIFVILFLLCDSWIVPFLYMTCIGIAVLINMGTNALLPSVSFMTFSIGALLQMGLSMDYSFMLMNRYNQEKLKTSEPETAMKNALRKAFRAITGSSVTTIVGLLALVFMSFKIGRDMGIVLAKGVFISLVCIFTILPGLTVKFDKLIMKTHKRSLEFPMNPIMKFVSKLRFVLVPAVFILVGISVMLQDGLKISYIKMFDNKDQEKIEEAFGVDNQMIVLYDKIEDAEHVDNFIQWLEEQDKVNFVQDYTNTIGKEYTYAELSETLGADITQTKLIYQMYKTQRPAEENIKATAYNLICFLDDDIIHDSTYSDFINAEQIETIEAARKQLDEGKAQLDAAITQLDEAEEQLLQAGMPTDEIANQRKALEQNPAYAMIYTEMTAAELAEVMEQDVTVVSGLMELYYMSTVDVEELRISLEECMRFITEDVMTDPIFFGAVSEDMKAALEEGGKEIELNKSMMTGEHYNRMILSAALPIEGEETFAFIGEVQEQAEKMLDGETYILNDSVMGYELDKGFGDELNFVTILTVVAILIVVWLTFRSLSVSVILVAVIQSAVYITMAVITLSNITVNYISLILVQCILMGATIDYGILFLSNYRELRGREEKKPAVAKAMNLSIKTIMTSSLILVTCCLTVGLIMTQKIIAQTCLIIAYGTISSVIMVIFVLPAVTLILDRFIVKKIKQNE